MALISDVRIRAKAKFTSTVTDAEFEIHIIDDEYDNTTDGDPLELTLDRDGFTLEQGEGDQLKHIMGGSFSMGIMVENSSVETLASDVMELQEDRFGVRLYEDEDLMWFGMVYQDGVNVDLQHQPYVFRVTAFDGLGKLKEISSGAPWATGDDPRNFSSVLVKMLREVDPLDLSNGTDFLVSAVDLRSDGHGAYNTQFDTLAETTVNNYNPLFYKVWDGKGVEFDGRNWYDIVTRIMFAFNSQIRLINGSYEVVPFTKMLVSTSTQVREFDRDYYETDSSTSNPRTFTGVSYSTRIFNTGFTNDKLQGLTVGFEQAADRVTLKEDFGQEILNEPLSLPNNAASGTFTTSDSGNITLSVVPGVFPAENQLSTTKECWLELRLYVTTVYNSQTYYWGPYRDTSSGHNFGRVDNLNNAWDTTERWNTVAATNFFDTLKSGSGGHVYPDFSTFGPFGQLTADELVIASVNALSPNREDLHVLINTTNGLRGGNGLGVFGVKHPSGSQGSITVQVQLVALDKNPNTITSDVDTDTITLTSSQIQAAGLRNLTQGATVYAIDDPLVDTFTHSLGTGQNGLSVLVKDIGSLHINDAIGGVPTEARAWDGTDWDNETSNWTDGTGTADTPLVTYLLRKHAQIYQKPVKRPDMTFISDVNLYGRTITGAGFPLGSAGEVQYIVLNSRFMARDNIMEQTWLEYDSNEVTGVPVTELPNRPNVSPYNLNNGASDSPGARDSEDPGLLPEVE